MMGAHSERFDQYLQIQDIAKLDKEIENITAESAKKIDNVKAEYVAELNRINAWEKTYAKPETQSNAKHHSKIGQEKAIREAHRDIHTVNFSHISGQQVSSNRAPSISTAKTIMGAVGKQLTQNNGGQQWKSSTK